MYFYPFGKKILGLLLWQFAALFIFNTACFAQERTVVLANATQIESVELAQYYMEQRGIPAENLVTLEMPTAETIGWDSFLDTVFNPLRKELVGREWIHGALDGDKTDPIGRVRGNFFGHKMDYLVVVKGVPLRIKEDAERLAIEKTAEVPANLNTNRTAVDSELAMLLAPANMATKALVPNPLFGQKSPPEEMLRTIVRVGRIDGASFADARSLIDSAMGGERYGLRGRAYIDLRGPHPKGDQWLEAARDQLQPLGFDLSVHTQPGLFPETHRFDAPALYFGWYANIWRGAAALEGMRFPPGAVGIHIHSFSAQTLRNEKSYLVAPMVHRGIAGTVGNTSEPYLELTHQPDLFLEKLADGGTLGEAAYYAVKGLSWQAILIGDPHYQPFKVSLEAQLARIKAGDTQPLDGYAIIRKMNLLTAAGETTQALELGQRYLYQIPSLPLALRLAQLYAEQGMADKAVQAASFAAALEGLAVDDVAVAADLAGTLEAIGTDEALTIAAFIWQILLDQSQPTMAQEKAWFTQAINTANKAGQSDWANGWGIRKRAIEIAEEEAAAAKASD